MTSTLRLFSASFLILTFLVIPFGRIHSVSYKTFPLNTVEANTDGGPATGHVTGLVHIGSVDTPTSPAHTGATIDLKLVENSETVIATAETDTNGAYDIEVPFGSYILCITPATGYRLADGVTQCQPEINLVAENTPLVQTTLMVLALPSLRLVGDTPYILGKGADFSSVDPGAEVLNLAGCSEDSSPTYVYTEDVVNSEVSGDTVVTYHIPPKSSCGYVTQPVSRIVRVLAPSPVANVIGSRVGAGSFTPPVVLDEKMGTSTASTTSTVTGEVAGVSTECRFINAYMQKSFENDTLEVLKLQAFLIFTVGDTTVKPTGVFDEATEIAVRLFQDKYKNDILEPWGEKENTGIVGMLTQKKVNDMYCGFVSAFTGAQELALESARDRMNARIAELPSAPLDSSVAGESISEKMSRWWDKAKENLVAAFPFGKNKEGEASTIEKSGNLAAAESGEGDQPYSWITVIISLLFGSAVVLIAGYLFKRTRVVVEKAK